MSIQTIIKQGNVQTYNIRQNTITYTLRIAHTPKGLWTCIEESYSQWKLTITQQLIDQTVTKTSGEKQSLTYKQFLTYLVGAINKQDENWSVGIMTSIELDLLRGGNGEKRMNCNKLYLILSNKQKKLHYPFTLMLSDMWEKEKLHQAIKKMNEQIQQLKLQRADKSFSSFSILSQTLVSAEQMKLQNQELKIKIKIYQDSLTQKRGAVEMDEILKQKNNLQIKAETRRRQDLKQITKLKIQSQLRQREIAQTQNQVDFIQKQLMLLEDNIGNSAKLKSHAMRVLKTYENDLRTFKKVVQKQVKQTENVKRNLLNSRNTEKRQLGKIKQLQQELEQAKKKTNVKQISNRLYGNSVGSRKSSASYSQKQPSETSNSKPKSHISSKSGMSGNIVRQNILKKASNRDVQIRNKNSLMKTTPNIKLSGSPSIHRKSIQSKPGIRPTVSSLQISTDQNYHTLKNLSPACSDKSPVRSAEDKKRQKAVFDRLSGVPKPKARQSLQQHSLNEVMTKGAFSKSKKTNPKQILSKMKQVKAYYSSKAQGHAENTRYTDERIKKVTGK